MNLEELHRDVLCYIVGFLETISIARFSAKNRRMRALFGKHGKLVRWSNIVNVESCIEYASNESDTELEYYSFKRYGSGNPEFGFQTAARYGREYLVELYITLGAKYYIAALYNAAEGGCLGLVKKFIGKCDDVGYILTAAACGGHLHIVKFLFENYNCTKWHTTALAAAVRNEHDQVLQFLLNKGIRMPFYWGSHAILNGNLQIVKTLFDFVAIDDLNEYLLYAVIHASCEIVAYIISKGANNFDEALRINTDAAVSALLQNASKKRKIEGK